MINNKKIIALIPARSGSQRLKNKNTLKFHRFPLITWTIKAATQSKLIDNIFISTDSKKIIEIAKKNNVIIPFSRPAYLSKNESKIEDVIIYSLNKMKEKFDIILLLQVTSPLRNSKE